MSTAQELVTKDEGAVMAPENQATALMHIIEKASLDPNMDVAKLEKLLDLKERWDSKQASLAFDAAMARVQSRIQPILADADNTQTGSKYAKLEAVVTALSPIYTAEGFSVSFGTDECGSAKLQELGWIRVTSQLTHSDGCTKHYHVDLPPDVTGPQGKVNKTHIHGAKSTITYARTILMGLMFNFTTTLDVDDDGNAASIPMLTDKQMVQLKDQFDALEINVPKFLEVLGVKRVEDIQAAMWPRCEKMIELKQRQAEGK